MNDERDAHVPQWLWLWFPTVLYFGHYIVHVLASESFKDRYLWHETGFTEQATVAVTVLALIFGLVVLRRFFMVGGWATRLFFVVFCLGCFYFAGEEASWGQHWLGWHTPADWDALNDQNETNLHNLDGVEGSLFDQLPRLLLGIATLVGGAIIPLVQRGWRKHYRPGSFAYWVMPGMACVPAGLMASLATVPQKISKAATGDVIWPLAIVGGEVKELMIGAFLLIYIATVWIRLRHMPKPAVRSHP